MAAIVTRKTGLVEIRFKSSTGQPQALRLGRVDRRTANGVRRRVEFILAADLAGLAIDRPTAAWLQAAPAWLRRRLAARGLIAAGSCSTIAELIDLATARKRSAAAGTRRGYLQLFDNFRRYFTAARPLAAITPADADDFKAWLLAEGGRHGGPLAATTVSKRIERARELFAMAQRREWIRCNPFTGCRAGPRANKGREVFIDRDSFARLTTAAASDPWRLLLKLARFGGLTVPSEALALQWDWVDWDRQRFEVFKPKTKTWRTVPIFAELAAPLSTAFHLAPAGSRYVVEDPAIRQAANLNTQLRRLVGRAGLAPWPRAWQNLRLSRQNELKATHPIDVVCAWMGNTAAVAVQHYLHPTENDFLRAINLTEMPKSTPEPPRTKKRTAPRGQRGHG